MKGHYKALGGRLVLEVNAEDVKGLLAQIGDIAEVLDADKSCGCCSSDNIYPSVREVKGYTYYSMRCSDCAAQLDFGQRKTGGLWAKRKEHPQTRGWHVWHGGNGADSDDPRNYSNPPSAPPPPPANSTPTELDELLARASLGGSEAQAVNVDLCDRLRGRFGEGGTQQIWDRCVKAHGINKPVELARALYQEWKR